MFAANAVARTAGNDTLARAVFEGPVFRNRKKIAKEHRDPCCRERNVKSQDENRTRDQHSDSRYPEVRTRESRTQSIGDNASQKRRDQTRDHSDQAKDRHAYLGTLISKTQISRGPKSQTADYKSHQRLGDAVDEIGACAEQIQVVTQTAAR